jgi:large conductance mechanosensitive channel
MDLKPIGAARNFTKEFRDFLLKTNLLSLALAVVIGGAVTKIIGSIVADLIMPVVGVLTPQGNWRGLTWGFWRFNWTYGNFLGHLLDFLIIAGIVFIITKAVIRNAPPPPSKVCAACKESIHPEATRCKFCTSEQPPLPPPAPAPDASKAA